MMIENRRRKSRFKARLKRNEALQVTARGEANFSDGGGGDV